MSLKRLLPSSTARSADAHAVVSVLPAACAGAPVVSPTARANGLSAVGVTSPAASALSLRLSPQPVSA